MQNQIVLAEWLIQRKKGTFDLFHPKQFNHFILI